MRFENGHISTEKKKYERIRKNFGPKIIMASHYVTVTWSRWREGRLHLDVRASLLRLHRGK